jgi:DNA-binding cell septation regulator SpoVG
MNRPPYHQRPNPGPQPGPPEPKKAPAFEVVDLRLIENAGSLRAYASVKIGPLTVHDFRIIKQADQDAWVSVPQKSWNTPEGERRFSPLLELPPDWKRPLSDAVIAAWQEHEAAKQQQTGGPA